MTKTQKYQLRQHTTIKTAFMRQLLRQTQQCKQAFTNWKRTARERHDAQTRRLLTKNVIQLIAIIISM